MDIQGQLMEPLSYLQRFDGVLRAPPNSCVTARLRPRNEPRPRVPIGARRAGAAAPQPAFSSSPVSSPMMPSTVPTVTE